MKKAILATLVGAAAMLGVTAGEWCPPAPNDKCPIEDCPDIGASISVGYESDYIFYGARLAQDSIWADVNYTFDSLPLPVTVGVWYLSAFGAPDDRPGLAGFGDEADFYASVGLPSICGFESSITYTAYTFPTQTYGADSGSTHELSLEISREILNGFLATYRVAHDFRLGGDRDGDGDPDGAWVHQLGLAKTIDINDCVALDLSGGVYYTDNYYANGNGVLDSGWNSYYLQAALPIALNCRATLTPYIGYNGTPDGWILDGSFAGQGFGGPNWGQNANDVLHWGISLGVDF